MVDVAQVERLTTRDVLSLAVELQRGVIEREAMKLVVAADWADRHCPASIDPDLVTRDPTGKVIPGADRARLFGGEGTPEVMEFAPAELGVAFEMSRWQANRLIADALDLRHRLPRLWARVLAGEVQAWKACKIAAATRHLSKEAAAQVDADTCEPVSRESWSRFCDILTGRIIAADPDLAQALADKAARARYVRTGRTNQHGLKSIHAQLPQGDVMRIMAQVNRLAKIMGALGDEDSPDERRAKAMAMLWAPDEVLALIAASEGIDLPDVDVDEDHHRPKAGEADGHYVPNNAKHYTPEDEYDVPPDPDLDPDPDGPPADAHEPTTADRAAAGAQAGDDHPNTTADDQRHEDNRQNGKRGYDNRDGARHDDDRHTGDRHDDNQHDDRHDHRHDRGDGNRSEVERHDDAGHEPTAAEASAGSGTDAGGERAAAPTGDRADDAPDRPATRAEPTGHADPENAEPPNPAPRADRRRQSTDDSGVGRENSAHDGASGEDSVPSGGPVGSAAGGDDLDSATGPDAAWSDHENRVPRSSEETERPPGDQPPRESSARSGWASRPSRSHGQGLSPQVARQMLKALAASGLDPAKLGPQIVLYHHYAHETLTAGNGTVRLEGAAAMTLHELRNYLHPFTRITVKPVIDLNAHQMPVDGYETPVKLREHLHLRMPGDTYPWSTYTGRNVQMDHTDPYRPLDKGGPAGQTRLGNLSPLVTFSHNVKTHGGTQARQPRPGTIVWRTRHGLVTITDHNGTHNLGTDPFAQAIWKAASQTNDETTGSPHPDPEPPLGPIQPQPNPTATCPAHRRTSRTDENIRHYISTIPVPPAQPTTHRLATREPTTPHVGKVLTWDLLPPRFALTL